MADKEIDSGEMDIMGQLEARILQLMTEQRALNRRATKLQRRNLRLEELNRIKDEFIAVASHQLRTPATGVKQYIGLLLEGYADPLTESQLLFLEKANESNNRQLRIIDDLLQVARIDSESFKLQLSEIGVRKVLREVGDDLHEKITERNQEITYDVPKKIIPIKADSERLRMVFENLIDNASNYSPPNSEIKVVLRASKGWAYVDIIDKGVGIDRRDFPKLFQKFSRIPNALSVERGGTGLGLYWAYKICQLHGGDIRIKSKLGVGSIFTVVLPIAES
jgi:signal transduction histidine kinase